MKLRDKLRPYWQESGEELFKRVAGFPGTIVFVLDEFPMMIDRMARSPKHREEAKTLLRWLRALRQSPNTTNVRFLIAGSIGIGHVLNDLGEISAINDFEQVRLEPFPPKTAAALLAELARSHEITLSQASRRKMLEVIGTHVPYFIQVMFSEAAKSHAQDGEPITPKRIEQIYREKVLGVSIAKLTSITITVDCETITVLKRRKRLSESSANSPSWAASLVNSVINSIGTILASDLISKNSIA